MVNDTAKYIEREFLSSDELVTGTTKTRTLNLISSSLDVIAASTMDTTILSLVEALRAIVADTYIISMYKFQFKIFTAAIEAEILELQKMVAHGN